MRMRKNVWTLPAGDQSLEWYGQAVDAMKKLPVDDPRNWTYQAAMHGVDMADPPPEWAQCQHATAFFVSWHRMYLLQFERIVAAQIKQLGGPENWALPYWDYSKKGKAEWRTLPPAFRENGEPGLYVAQRSELANNGKSPFDDRDVDLSALKAGGSATAAGFFGTPNASHTSGGGAFGRLEATVHNNVHNALGAQPTSGAFGLMGDPDYAGLDPIFWLHHANIDRLWVIWLTRPDHVNLASTLWRNTKFGFFDADGKAVSMTTADVLDPTAPALDYAYEDVTDPFAGEPDRQRADDVLLRAGNARVKPVFPRELVGATTAPVTLIDAAQHVALPTVVTPHAFAASRLLQPQNLQARRPSELVQTVDLLLENVTGAARSPVYDVYLNVPDPAHPENADDHFVGRVSMFGLAQASSTQRSHGGSGQNFEFDITALYHRLADAGQIDKDKLRVSFVPVRGTSTEPVQVGRIGLYFA